MPLSFEQIKKFIKEPQNEYFLTRANEIRKVHELHVAGIGVQESLDIIEGVENKDAVSLRRALAQEITVSESNRIITGENKVFSARGGGRFYDFSNENEQKVFKKVIKNVRAGQSIHNYMQKEWKRYVNLDPSGILFTEINPKDETLYITYKSSGSLHDVGFNSATDINYIIFKPVIDEHGNKYYRIVDDRFDYLVKETTSEITIINDETYQNYWGFVPATFISDRQDKKSNAFDTHISEAMIHANDMLYDYTIYKIYKTKQGIPYIWQYEKECATCGGSGNVEKNTCSACNGRGYDNHNRNVADIIVLPLPEEGDVPIVPPAGYVQASLETWTQFETTMEKESNKMYTSVWGDVAFIDGKRNNVTASEVIIRENSKESKLNDISENAENVERKLTDIFGYYYFPNSYNGAIINYGRDYYVKSSDELINEYETSLQNNVSSTELTNILERYYHTLYSKSPQRLNESLIKLKAKPFYHWQPEKLQSANVNEVDYTKNLYFDEFLVWYEQNIAKLGVSTLEEVQNALEKWIIQKIPVEANIIEIN